MHTWMLRFLRGKLLPWPCNMWHLVPRRSRRKRSGHRQTSQVAAAPIIFSRLPGALSTRSADAPERQNPGFIGGVSLRPFSGFVLSHSCPVAKVGRKKNRAETERTWAPAAPPCFPDDANIRAAGVHRSHLRCHFSLNSTGTVRKIGVGCRGRGESSSPVLTVKPHGDSGQRPCVPAPRNYSFSFGMVRAGINTFECFLHLSAYSLLSTSNPPLFLCACVSSLWIFRDHLGRWAAKSAYYPSMDSLSAAEINSLIDFCERPRLPSANKLDGLNVSH